METLRILLLIIALITPIFPQDSTQVALPDSTSNSAIPDSVPLDTLQTVRDTPATAVALPIADTISPPPKIAEPVFQASSPPTPSTPVKPRKQNIAVIEFSGSFKKFSREDIQAITTRFETELMKTDSFVVLERRNMDVILQEQGFQQTGACNSEDCQVKVGQLLGVDRIISGEITKMNDFISLNLKMIDVEKGNSVLSHALDIKGDIAEVLRGGCYEMAQIFSGRKSPDGKRSILVEEKSSWLPWIIGGVGVLATGVGVYLYLDSKDNKRDDYTIDQGF